MSYLPRTLFKGGKSSVDATNYIKVQDEKQFLSVVADGYFVCGHDSLKDMMEKIPEVKSIMDRKKQIMNQEKGINSEAGIDSGEMTEMRNEIAELKQMVNDSNEQMAKMSAQYQAVVQENDELKAGDDKNLIEVYEKETGTKALIAGGPNKGKELKAFTEWKEERKK